MREKIAAIVITYNRKVLLMNCMAALLTQSRPPDMIYVIDNASTDGTEGAFQKIGYMEHSAIRYERLSQNIGGSGGFAVGIERSFRDGYDYLWLMDDDAEPKAEALERMIPFVGREDISAIANLKVDSEGNVQYNHLGRISWSPFRNLVKPISAAEYENKESVEIQFSSFVGLLVNRRAVERVGMPCRDFYIHFDDTEFCLRLLDAGKILLIPSSVIVHNSPRVFPARKRFLVFSAAPLSLEVAIFKYYGDRNCTWTVKEHGGFGRPWALIWAFVHAAKWTLKATLFERDHYWTRLYIIFRAYWDGLTNRFDNDLPRRALAKLAK